MAAWPRIGGIGTSLLPSRWNLIPLPVPFSIPTSQVLVLLVSWDHIASLYALPTLGHMNTPLHKHLPCTGICVIILVSSYCDGEGGVVFSCSCRNWLFPISRIH